MYIPELIAVDFETSGLAMYEADAVVTSAAFAWYRDGEIRSKVIFGQRAVGAYLSHFSKHQIPLACYNAQFEMLVVACKYPGLNLNWQADVQRLVQCYDSGGLMGEYGLKASTTRILPEFAHYEQPIYEWIRANVKGVKRGKEGAHLSQAPIELLTAYNKADAEITLRLYTIICDSFASEGFDWKEDHALYLPSCKLLTEAKIRGIKVNREHTSRYIDDIDTEIAAMDAKFRQHFAVEIEKVREKLRLKNHPQHGTEKHRKNGVSTCAWYALPEFNITSAQHLGLLFEGEKGLEAVFHTPTGRASFKNTHLPSWGEGGEMLTNRKKRLVTQSQCKAMLVLSAYDDRWHQDLRACGTRTGRFAGGGGLNVQGLSRRDKGQMSAFLADEGKTFVSIDLAAGEPSVTTHYSSDEMYAHATVTGVGKAPYWQDTVLMIDDPYIQFMSVSPVGRSEVYAAWKNGFDGKTFVEQWLEDSEVVKKALKKQRQLHKICFLGLSYGMGSRTLQKTLFENGYQYKFKECQQLFKTYWNLYSGVKAFSDYMAAQVEERRGVLVNEYGFRMQVEPHKGFNGLIQSTVSSILHLFCGYIFELAPWAEFITVIHDELIVQVPDERLLEFAKVKEEATDKLNQRLGMRVAMRTGFVSGKDLFTAK